MGLFDGIINRLANAIADRVTTSEGEKVLQTRAYRLGDQPKKLKVRGKAVDDNIIVNFTGLVVNRMVSQMFAGGITLDFGDLNDTPDAEWVRQFLMANKEEILFHRSALSAAESGTGFWKLMPDGVVGDDGNTYPRIVIVDPAFTTIKSDPNDWELVTEYDIQYKLFDDSGKFKIYKTAYKRQASDAGKVIWIEEQYETDTNQTRFKLVSSDTWDYDFSRILHWQNLPAIDRAEGEPDITSDVIELQDRVNFISSNLSKIIRLFAHPSRYGKNLPPVGKEGKISLGPDDLINFVDNTSGGSADIKQLPVDADIQGSLGFLQFLRQALFDITREVDIDSISDKLGALTNFGLKVLYQDNLSKIGTKRELMSDAIEELVRRAMIISNKQPLHVEVIWRDFLPENKVELATYYQTLQNMGILDKQTIQTELHYDPKKIAVNLHDEQVANKGALVDALKNFGNGQ